MAQDYILRRAPEVGEVLREAEESRRKHSSRGLIRSVLCLSEIKIGKHPEAQLLRRNNPTADWHSIDSVAGTVRSELAQGDRHRPDRRSNRGKQPTEHAHHQRKQHTHQKKIEGDLERESKVGKGLPIHGVGGQTIERKNREAADQARSKRYQQSFKEEGKDDIPGGKTKCPHGGDFAPTLGYRGVHGVQSPEYRADRHNGGNETAENGYEPGHRSGLLGVIVYLSPHVHVHTRISGDGIFELLESSRRSKVNGCGLKNIVGTLQNLAQDMRIAPDFRVEGRTTRVEYADHLPAAAAKIDAVADGEPRVGSRSILTHNKLRQTGLEHPPFNDLCKVADGEDVG